MTFGCGATYCASCYPLQYACEFCNETFEKPVSVGEAYECPNCEWLNDRRPPAGRDTKSTLTE